jgi:hypothetical protein
MRMIRALAWTPSRAKEDLFQARIQPLNIKSSSQRNGILLLYGVVRFKPKTNLLEFSGQEMMGPVAELQLYQSMANGCRHLSRKNDQH